MSVRYDVAFVVPSVTSLLTGSGVPAGGAETQVMLLAKTLAARGLRTCVVAFDDRGGLPRQVDGVAVIPRPPFRGGRGAFAALHELIEVTRTTVRLDAAAIVTRIGGPHVGVVGAVARLRGRRFVYSSASITDFDFAARRPSRRDRVLHELGLRIANAIVAQTAEQAALCRERLGREAVVAPNIALPAAAGTPSTFLWVGRLAWYKRPLAYIELARALPDAEFSLVGVPSRDSPELADTVRRAAADVPNLTLLDPRPRPELLRIVGEAVAIVNTSDFEGMPNVTLEGWARGVPTLALAYDPDGVIEHYHLGVFARGSWDRFVAGATQLWRRDAAGDYAERCRRYVAEAHSPDAAAAGWLKALDLSSRPAPVAVGVA